MTVPAALSAGLVTRSAAVAVVEKKTTLAPDVVRIPNEAASRPAVDQTSSAAAAPASGKKPEALVKPKPQQPRGDADPSNKTRVSSWIVLPNLGVVWFYLFC